MRLVAQCPRCRAALLTAPRAPGDPGECPVHGVVPPLWRSGGGGYEEFVEYLTLAGTLPAWLPWPVPPGWQVSDFGCVAADGRPRAAFAGCSGESDADGLVELTVVTEEPGTGLGARCAGITSDPGPDALAGPPAARLRVDGATAPLWPVSTSDTDTTGDLDRSVLVGESHGRWLWLVVRPASAALLLPELGALRDVSGLGAQLVDLPFAHRPRSW